MFSFKLLIYNDKYNFRGPLWILKNTKSIGYEPRGSGFNSCQPHQMNTPEIARFPGFFCFRALRFLLRTWDFAQLSPQ